VKRSRPNRILLVTGMSGAGKSTALKSLEDMGWETVDNLPLLLLDRLLVTKLPEGASDDRPLAFGIDSRTRGFDASAIVERIKALRERGDDISTVFLDCGGSELERRYSETRRRHPLALDRPATDGIARERELLSPLRRWADHVIDTTSSTSNDLRLEMRTRFGERLSSAPTLSVMSFGFARGVPRNADLVFDMRFLRNPHWDDTLRPMSGLDQPVADYIAGDPAYEDAVSRIEDLLLLLLPRYEAEGKAYVTIAFGCTGGRHRSVHVTTRVGERLRDAGFSPTVSHRDLASRPDDSLEGLDAGANVNGRRNITTMESQ
jgi:RNase adapter protein RapZ